MTILPERYCCDTCGEPVPPAALVTLQVDYGPAIREAKGRDQRYYISHHHLSCWEDDGDVAHAVMSAAVDHDFDARDLEDPFDRIPTATQAEVDQARRAHRHRALHGMDASTVVVLRAAGIRNCFTLQRAGINTLSDAARMSDEHLLALRGVGPAAVRAVRAALDALAEVTA